MKNEITYGLDLCSIFYFSCFGEWEELYEIGLNLDILEDPTGKNCPEWTAKFKKAPRKFPILVFPNLHFGHG